MIQFMSVSHKKQVLPVALLTFVETKALRYISSRVDQNLDTVYIDIISLQRHDLNL